MAAAGPDKRTNRASISFVSYRAKVKHSFNIGSPKHDETRNAIVLPATTEEAAVCTNLKTRKVVWYLQASEHYCSAISLHAEVKENSKRQQQPLLQQL
jgi:hypothetical protein